jgi:hypothetical protein
MFYSLLLVTFAIAFGVSFLVVQLFKKPADQIFKRIIQDEIASAWTTYLKFALFVVGISSGVRLGQLERYLIKPSYGKDPQVEVLTREKWVLELYRTIIETLQGVAWVLLMFFIVSLIAFILVRLIEVLRKNKETTY